MIQKQLNLSFNQYFDFYIIAFTKNSYFLKTNSKQIQMKLPL